MKYRTSLFVLLGVTSCSGGQEPIPETTQTVHTYQEETNTSYEGEEIVPSCYQLSVPPTFERAKDIEMMMPEQMLFLREPEDMPFVYDEQDFRTIREDQATLVVEPQKKFFYHLFQHPDLSFVEEPTEEELDALPEEARQAAENDSEAQEEAFKEESLEGGPQAPFLGEDEWSREEVEVDTDMGP
ncbi:hypothetical protein [Shouchella shacheensis]|uniref:hypothetical protein n=1 Tax=Shouchella shacheensis TaxID=1649580 RepID=UPI0007402726|nr:hypothetical protein [Shouchella shacheensis]